MAANPFFSGRIPQGLLDAVEEYRQRTGESKTDVLVKALSALVNYQLSETDLPARLPSTWLDEKFNALEQRIEALGDLAAEIAGLKHQMASFTTAPRIDNKPDISPDNTVPNKKQLLLLSDNNTDNNTDNSTDNIKADEQNDDPTQESKADYLPEGEWDYLGEMQFGDIAKIIELQKMGIDKLKNKIRNTMVAKNRQVLVEPYFWKVAGHEPGKKRRVIYKVYRRKP